MKKVTESAKFYQVILFSLDVFTILGIYFLTIFFRYDSGYLSFIYPSAPLVIVCVSIILTSLVGGYENTSHMLSLRFMVEYLIAQLIALMSSLVLIYFAVEYDSSMYPARANILLVLLLFPVLGLCYRRLLFSRLGVALEKKLIYVIGVGPMARNFHRVLVRSGLPYKVSFFDPNEKRAGKPLVSELSDSPVIQGDLLQSLNDNLQALDTVVIAERKYNISEDLARRLADLHFNQIKVQSLLSFFAETWKMVPISEVSHFWLMEEDRFQLNKSYTYDRIKRFFDIVLSCLLIAVFLPVIIITAFLIKLESRGSVLFVQDRIGKNRTSFRLYKFRSMYIDSKRKGLYTQDDDERITKVGRLLRRTRIDELPQLWNVLKGDMSVIGPRPEWTECVKLYESDIYFYHYRHLVKPGITGWAQVNYPYGASAQAAIDKLEYDLFYVSNYSFHLDFSICLKTIYIMLGFHGK